MACYAVSTDLFTDLLQNYRAAMEKRLGAMEDLQEQVNAQKDPDMQAKLRECQEAEEQLRDIELKLGEYCRLRWM